MKYVVCLPRPRGFFAIIVSEFTSEIAVAPNVGVACPVLPSMSEAHSTPEKKRRQEHEYPERDKQQEEIVCGHM